jgi:hypothetical protein
LRIFSSDTQPNIKTGGEFRQRLTRFAGTSSASDDAFAQAGDEQIAAYAQRAYFPADAPKAQPELSSHSDRPAANGQVPRLYTFQVGNTAYFQGAVFPGKGELLLVTTARPQRKQK